jgi:hypothetical protein
MLHERGFPATTSVIAETTVADLSGNFAAPQTLAACIFGSHTESG